MIFKRGKIYWYKFMWNGSLVRESTKQGNDKVARQMESAHRTSLAKGEVGIREKKPAPALAEFLKNDFLPYTDATFESKPATARYYNSGAKSLTDSLLSNMRIDEINDQHARQYASKLSHRSPSTINCGLRTLKRALNLAVEWGRMDRLPKIKLAKGEKQRDRVLTASEVDRYLNACEQPWRDVATIMLNTAMRPSEVFALRWENILLNEDGTGLIQIVRGKSKAARRVLPVVPVVFHLFQGRWEAQDKPSEGWLFPSGSSCGHFEGSTAKGFHARALTTVPELKKFPPYVLRHTALTELGEDTDPFTLAKIAGHSSITITQRYVHPQADAIERAFAKWGGAKSGHSAKMKDSDAAQESQQTAVIKRR